MSPISIEGVRYESLAEASRSTGIPSPTILWRIRSKNKKYTNYKKEEYEKNISNTINNIID